MRASNQKAAKYLLRIGCTDVWFKSHTRYTDVVYNKWGIYKAKDVWRLFDGACWKMERDKKQLYFFQVKTDRFAPEEPIRIMLKDSGIKCFNIHVNREGVHIRII